MAVTRGLTAWVVAVLRASGLTPWARAVVAFAARRGAPVRLQTVDREVLEKRILPVLGRQDALRCVLFVGADWYTVSYERFFRRKEYWTVEPDPGRRVYGARRHIVGKAEEVGDRFSPGYFDVVICNGVFGWGLNELDAWTAALNSFYTVLRPGGWFIFGWDDTPRLCPFPPLSAPAAALFENLCFPGIGAARLAVGRGSPHVFDFLSKPT